MTDEGWERECLSKRYMMLELGLGESERRRQE